ncbi:neuropeptide CCHamide-1 receptor-like [Periplaneta americana]|uniref:neuropeptide CCHamide-1 receptor-like n=1 Tax=Periplaneta americana TaxID=6978 RepID=UPI0037E9887B
MFPGLSNVILLTTMMVVQSSSLKSETSILNSGAADLKVLIIEDLALNMTWNKTWDIVSKFLFSGNMDEGLTATENMRRYVTERKSWIQSMAVNGDILTDGSLLENRNRYLENAETSLKALSTMYDISMNYSDFEDMKKQFLNLSNEFNDTYEYEIGLESIIVTEEYLIQLEVVNECVAGINNSLVLHNPGNPSISTWIDNFPNLKECEKYYIITRESISEQKILLSRIKSYLIFRDYIDPPLYIFIMLIGMVWNIVLLIMFVRRKEVRTAPNIMIFNIVIADVMNLTFNLPLQYFGFYYPSHVRLSEPVCILFISLRCMFTSASALSVVALSAQRFCATLSAFHNFKARSQISSTVITIVYILFIWAAASSIVLPDTLLEKVCDDKPSGNSGRKSAKVVSLHEFIVYCFALPGLMFFFTFLTARRLRRSAREMPGDTRHTVHEEARNRGATVVTALCIVFTISYVPFFMWGRIATLLSLDRWKLPFRILDNITYYLLFSNPCFNPLALYVSSRTFRRLFNSYLFGWFLRRRKLKRTDTELSTDTTTQSTRQQESDISRRQESDI